MKNMRECVRWLHKINKCVKSCDHKNETALVSIKKGVRRKRGNL